MATFTIEFSVADEHMDRIRAALRKHFGPAFETITEEVANPLTGELETRQIPTTRELTPEELLAKVRQMSIDNIKTIVMNYEANEAIAIARASVNAVIVE
jgi:hypothetical protein